MQNILIIDDDAADRALYKNYLTKIDKGENYHFHEAVNGQEGLDLLEKLNADCVLLDYMLPDTDGLQLLKQLTKNQSFLPVVIMTGHGNEFLAVEAIRSGAQDYVPKNMLSPQVLRRAIRNAIDRSNLLSRLDAQNHELQDAREAAEQGRRKAEEADRAKSEFLATMSHEIRTPMNGIIGMAELMGYTRLDNRQKQYLNSIQTSGELLLMIINDILDFSKIEARELVLESRPVKLEDLLAEVVHILAGRAHENRVELILNWPHREALPVLISDPLRLRQILLNLIGNAIKFTHDGHVLIHVRVQKRDKKYIYLRFEVHDTGIGIPKEKIEKIFNEFTQVDSSTTREYGGTGLGLAICKRLVERMDGKIGVQSSPGQGSTFWFEMRFALSATERSEDEAPAADPLHLNHDNILSGKNVLLVDDNVVNLEIISAYLVAAGMIVETANSGLDALKLLRSALDREQKFDLLVIDEAMPKMGGESLLEKIKAKPDLYGDAPCVLMTAIRKAHSSSASNDIALPQISKPVYPRDLLQTLRQIISGKMPSRNVKAQTVHETKSLQQFKSHVLIAEDDRVSQRMAAGILEALGCTYEIVNDGEEALNKLAQNPDAFDLVLMDWQMPNMDGHAAIREIRKTSWGKNINILALTANAIQGDREKCIKAGANDYLSKPVRIGDVSTVLMRYK